MLREAAVVNGQPVAYAYRIRSGNLLRSWQSDTNRPKFAAWRTRAVCFPGWFAYSVFSHSLTIAPRRRSLDRATDVVPDRRVDLHTHWRAARWPGLESGSSKPRSSDISNPERILRRLDFEVGDLSGRRSRRAAKSFPAERTYYVSDQSQSSRQRTSAASPNSTGQVSRMRAETRVRSD